MGSSSGLVECLSWSGFTVGVVGEGTSLAAREGAFGGALLATGTFAEWFLRLAFFGFLRFFDRLLICFSHLSRAYP